MPDRFQEETPEEGRVNVFDTLAFSNNRERQAWIEARAKVAYDALIGTAGPPFGNFPARTIVGWKRVVETLDKEPRCWKCGAGMICSWVDRSSERMRSPKATGTCHRTGRAGSKKGRMMQVNIFDILAFSNNRDRQAWIEARAKVAYDALIGTAGPPFNNLPARTIVGWKRVVEALDKEPRCWQCGDGMICLKCKEQTE